ncbi:MAG TPA: WecB/TagA/CpsF family glycosyltransferase [Chthoniobacterales bacterium]|nr:WecB/TagA/CpsF family glycosyltransferase [Chthoniobacterales bacterium]
MIPQSKTPALSRNVVTAAGATQPKDDLEIGPSLHFKTDQVLGIRFFDGTATDAVNVMCNNGGFLIAPSGTCFSRLTRDIQYREAVAAADLAIPDSGAMVLLWKLIGRRALTRISGWNYLRHLSSHFFQNRSTKVFWVVPNAAAGEKTAEWLRQNNFPVQPGETYVAPMYEAVVQDPTLLQRLEEERPEHVVVGIGSGPQEKLGHYLRRNLTYRPAIHCIGAALGFLTGDQVAIPGWADRYYLGWAVRLFSQPRVFIPRLAKALELPLLMLRYRSEMPKGPIHQ